MAVGRCEQCGTEEYMPFVCKFCKGRYCVSHRLPENHACRGLTDYKEKVRKEGRIMVPEGDVMTPSVRRSAQWSASVDRLFLKAEGKMTYVFIGLAVLTFFLQFTLGQAMSPSAYVHTFVVTQEFWRYPWTVVTSIFAHGGFRHLLFNMIALFFFGRFTEGLLGSRRFTFLFFAAGIVAGIAQVLIFGAGALGASGALLGIMGALVVIAPKLQVYLFGIIPMQLWVLVVGFAALDVLGAMGGATLGAPNTAYFAHLAGLAIGLAYGYKLRSQGLRAQVPRTQGAGMRRNF